MCGVFLAISKTNNGRMNGYGYFGKSKNRGPDKSIFLQKKVMLGNDACDIELGFHHLQINDFQEFGGQPFFLDDGSFCISNAEIYNSDAIKEKHLQDYNFRSDSDCEVIYLYLKNWEKTSFMK